MLTHIIANSIILLLHNVLYSEDKQSLPYGILYEENKDTSINTVHIITNFDRKQRHLSRPQSVVCEQ